MSAADLRSKRTVLGRLRGGDRRSIGRANKVAVVAARDPRIFAHLIEGLWHEDPVVRLRAADAAEKASAECDELLAPFKAELLGLLFNATEPELRWHLCQMVPRLKLTASERQRAALSLRKYLEDRSSLVKTFAMQALSSFAEQDDAVRGEIIDLIRKLTRMGTPAMRARGRKLLARWETRN